MAEEKSWALGYTVLFTCIVIAIGVALVFSTKFYDLEQFVAESFIAIGITLISAGTIGVITELFLMWFITKKMLKLESNFLGQTIPQIIETVHGWVSTQGKSIPIDKNSLYRLIQIGYSQWFMTEDFETLGIPSSKVAKLYHDVQLNEFKEPIILDFSLIVKFNGYIDKSVVSRDDLIDITLQTKFVAVNTAKKDSEELRYINRNGLVSVFAFDIFENQPNNETTKKQFIDRQNRSLIIHHDDTEKEIKIILIEIDGKKLSRIIEKDTNEITKIIETQLGRTIKNDEAFLIHHFFGEKSDENRKFAYVLFCPYALKPQQRVTITYKRNVPFAENDFIQTSMKSLTRGITFQLEGFDKFDTAIMKYLLNDEKDTTTQTKSMLSTSALMLPRSSVIGAWQKKKLVQTTSSPKS